MLDRLAQLEKRFNDIEREMATEESVENPRRLQELAQERAGLEDVVVRYRRYQATSKSLDELRAMLETETDDEMRSMVKQETASLEARLAQEQEELKTKLMTAEFATWHVILDRRAEIIAQAKIGRASCRERV